MTAEQAAIAVAAISFAVSLITLVVNRGERRAREVELRANAQDKTAAAYERLVEDLQAELNRLATRVTQVEQDCDNTKTVMGNRIAHLEKLDEEKTATIAELKEENLRLRRRVRELEGSDNEQ